MELKKDVLKTISSSLTNPTNDRNSRSRNANLSKSNIYLYKNVVPKASELNAGKFNNSVALPKDSAVALIDHAPLLNWGHPCTHVLFDANSGEEYARVESTLPLSEFYTDYAGFETIQEKVKFKDFAPKIEIGKEANIKALNIETCSSTGERYAILFSGMSDNRHVNDMEFLYRVLIDVYKFKEENIHVLNENGSVHYKGWGNGNRWPGDNTNYRMKVKGEGTRTALINAIGSLRNKLKKDDLLFIHTNNHGGRENDESFLCCWPNWWPSLSASDFGREIAKLPKFRSLIVMMEQCFSGGFMDETLRNSPAHKTYFSAACAADRSSMGGEYFDPFALSWISAINGKGPDSRPLLSDADSNYNNRVSVSEAHDYAKRHKHPLDTPVSGGYPFRPIGSILYLDDPQMVVGNRNSLEFHQLGCSWVQKMAEYNIVLMDSPQEAVNQGYNGCWYCHGRYDTD